MHFLLFISYYQNMMEQCTQVSFWTVKTDAELFIDFLTFRKCF